MRFDLKKPCGNCPFKSEGGIRLHPGRAQDIGEMMESFDGGSFTCHKTSKHDGEGEAYTANDSQHCAGALIYAMKKDNFTQSMRLAERLRIWDPNILEGFDEIIDDWEEMSDG